MRSFWFNFDGVRLEIIFKLIARGTGKWRTNHLNSKMKILEFEYPPAEEILSGDTTISIADFELEELDPAVLSMLFQTLQMDAPKFNVSYS
jgi:hypothetical protein